MGGKNQPTIQQQNQHQKSEIPPTQFLRTEMLHYPSVPQRLICGDGGARAEAFAGKVWERPSVNIVLAAFPMLLRIDSLGVVSAAGKACLEPLCVDILLKWDMNALGKMALWDEALWYVHIT